MTKEALEKEAKKYGKKATAWLEDREPLDQRDIENAYLAAAESREKQIQIDAEQIRALQKQNGELTDKLTKKSDTNHQLVEKLAKLNERCSELEAQIEKMKSDVMGNIKWADQNKNNQMYCKLNAMINQWEIKEKMNEEELKNKCTKRAKSFQQAMESCHSSSPIDCIEWFADRIAELEADNDARKFAMAMSEKVEKQLREENAKLKDEWQEQVQKANDEGYARTLQTMQLTKAKKIIQRLVTKLYKYTRFTDDVLAEAEQFLNSEVEK